MSKVQMLRAFVNQRLTAAAEEIFELFETTIAEYEEKLEFSSKENHRQQKLLDAVYNPEVRSHRADVQQPFVVKEEASPEQQEWSSSLDQEDPEPPHIKEEQEELWSSQEGEQLQGLEEADVKFTVTSVSVKSEEEDEEIPQSSQFYNRQTEQMETEADGEDCGGPEPARNSDSDTHLQPDTIERTLHSEPETDDSRDWEDTQESQSDSNLLQNNEVPVSDMDCNTGKTSLRDHAGKNCFTCSVCKANFSLSNSLVKHMRIHTEEKPFCCTVCSKRFAQRQHLRRHLTFHSGVKPFSCSVCSKKFTLKQNMKRHLVVHTGEKPFSCSICSKGFALKGDLRRHLTVHTGEKPFSCSVCNKRYTRPCFVKRHKCVGESSSNNSSCGDAC
ncbi:zinc finger protein 135-like isoform X1 [Epinephelus moara]|uniref:zinc finger protein 135-like isoform X1 n=1 Tax=Epinephelus moara TaxID=300413 RepID=UPI00214E5DFF|nr:zinc finger protein 135-like isoform X1 [Epinephelus moara]